ncbi:MAG: hypothetical protein ABL993_04155 [Vicinamibacterales bacterium]
MSEPLRTDSVQAPGPSGAADRAARVEQFLLSGLDCYFAGQYEQAINVWTRVVFLDRGHGRARAYIARARAAMAERQRESEEVLHRGVAAYDEGDIAAARDLLTKAVEDGGTADEAMVFLERLNRVTAVRSVRETAPLPSNRPPGAPEKLARRQRPSILLWFIAAIVVGGVALGAAPVLSWLMDFPAAAGAPGLQEAKPEPLPIVRTSDALLARARALHAGGHLRDALGLLDRIDIGDPIRGEADRVRADIQRDLLATATPQPLVPPRGEPGR